MPSTTERVSVLMCRLIPSGCIAVAEMEWRQQAKLLKIHCPMCLVMLDTVTASTMRGDTQGPKERRDGHLRINRPISDPPAPTRQPPVPHSQPTVTQAGSSASNYLNLSRSLSQLPGQHDALVIKDTGVAIILESGYHRQA